MKKTFVLFLLFSACNKANHFSGIYTRHVESEYSVGEDTLFISHVDSHYTIERHTGYRNIKNGQPGKRQTKRQYSVLLDAGDNQWQDAKTGTFITVNSNGLLLGTAVYQKIK